MEPPLCYGRFIPTFLLAVEEGKRELAGINIKPSPQKQKESKKPVFAFFNKKKNHSHEFAQNSD
ncbi:MAG: hypothetical protein RSB39_04440 [Oscillospiraceae bacterium]